MAEHAWTETQCGSKFIYDLVVNKYDNIVTTMIQVHEANDEDEAAPATVWFQCGGEDLVKIYMSPGQIVPIDVCRPRFHAAQIWSTEPISVRSVYVDLSHSVATAAMQHLRLTEKKMTADSGCYIMGNNWYETYDDPGTKTCTIQLPEITMRAAYMTVARTGLESTTIDLKTKHPPAIHITSFAREPARANQSAFFFHNPVDMRNSLILHIRGGAGVIRVEVHGYNVVGVLNGMAGIMAGTLNT